MNAKTTTSTGATGSISRLLTEQEAADLLAISVRTLQDQRLRGGGCPYVKLSRSVRYRADDLAAYIEASRRHHTSEGAR